VDLFSKQHRTPISLGLPDSDICYFPDFYIPELANLYFERLLNEIVWRQDDIKVFGKIYAQPRLTALYGDTDKPYSYSGIRMQPTPFTPLLQGIKQDIEEATSARFTTVLLNLYRSGQDSNGWHSDDEKELGNNPEIASLSLGATRKFHLRHKEKKLRHSIALEHGSLLLMKGSTQHCWQHQIPKTKKTVDPRINLTFRFIHS
jgi:alkylated DNA repair dioxygenase AlkB